MLRRRLLALLTVVTLSIGWAGQAASVSAAQEATPEVSCVAGTPQENLAVVRRFYEEGVNGGDVNVFDEVVVPAVLYHGATVGAKTNLKDLKDTYQEVIDAFEGITYTLVSATAGPDAVAVRYQAQGKNTGEFRKIPATGNT